MKKRIKAEVWDKQQNIMYCYYDGMIHSTFYFDGKVDENAFYAAINYVVSKIDVLHCSYHNSFCRAHWHLEEFKKEDVFTITKTTNDKQEEKCSEFLCGVIPETSNVQFKCNIVRTEDKDAINFLISHMCLDGGDIKQLLKIIIASYNQYKKEGKITVAVKNGARNVDQLYKQFNEEDKKHAKGLYKNVSTIKYKYKFAFEKTPEDKPTINKRKLSVDTFTKMKAKGKTDGATINDIITAAYLRTVYKYCNMDKNAKYSMNCMMDLRKYMKNGQSEGFCNLIGFLECALPNGIGNTFADTLKDVKASFDAGKQDRFAGLYSHPLLKLAFTLFPHQISKIAIKIGFFFPFIGMSNIGITKEDDYVIPGLKLLDVFMTGTIKKKPYIQLALTTFNGEITFSCAMNCNEKDKLLISNMLADIEKEILGYINS